jgi:hypothetical protein
MPDNVERPTQSDIVLSVMRAVPHSDGLKMIDLSIPNAVRFDWRGTIYKADSYGGRIRVYEDEGSALAGSDKAILMEALLCMEWMARFMGEA